MKNFKSLLSLIVLSVFLTSTAWSQIKQVDFLTGGINDAKPLFESYLLPYANSFGAGLNAGWYNTAKPHKLGGFDVTLTFNAAWAPKMDRSFDLTKIGLSDNVAIEGNPIAPTVGGKMTPDRPELVYTQDFAGETIELARYKVPNGTGINMVPIPMAQLGVGLPFGTDVTVRYLPSINIGENGNVGLWGVGGKHSISQHIPFVKRIPVLDVSVQGGYTKLNTYANVDFKPEELVATAQNLVTDQGRFDDQRIDFTASAWTINIVASQTLPVITFYQGIGYSNSTVNFGLLGDYPMASLATTGAFKINYQSRFKCL
jgi:hypothetical protein